APRAGRFVPASVAGGRPRGARAGPPRPATAADEPPPRVGPEPLREPLELIGGDPAGLADVVSVRGLTNLIPSVEARIGRRVERDLLTGTAGHRISDSETRVRAAARVRGARCGGSWPWRALGG